MTNTRSQRFAQEAYARVEARRRALPPDTFEEYESFARQFPTLVHSCGLAQAVAFARAKGGQQLEYVEDVAAVLRPGGYARLTDAVALAKASREESVAAYLRLSRDALTATVWLKRYVEAIGDEAAVPAGGQS